MTGSEIWIVDQCDHLLCSLEVSVLIRNVLQTAAITVVKMSLKPVSGSGFPDHEQSHHPVQEVWPAGYGRRWPGVHARPGSVGHARHG